MARQNRSRSGRGRLVNVQYYKSRTRLLTEIIQVIVERVLTDIINHRQHCQTRMINKQQNIHFLPDLKEPEKQERGERRCSGQNQVSVDLQLRIVITTHGMVFQAKAL